MTSTTNILPRRAFLLGVGQAALLAGFGRPSLAASDGTAKLDLAKLQPYWNEVPDSAISKVFVKHDQFPNIWGVIGPRGTIDAWSGAAWCTSRKELILAACGGHSDYYGNEVYAFSRDTLRWTRARDPSPIEETLLAGDRYQIFKMKDGPESRHTYSALVWAENAGRIMVGGGASAPSGQTIGTNWLYDPKTKNYEALPERVLETIGGYDPERGLVICVGAKLNLFDAATKKLVRTTPLRINAATQFGCGDYDSDTKSFVFFAGPNLITMLGLANPSLVIERGYSQDPVTASALARSGWSWAYPLLNTPPGPDDAITVRHGVAYHPPSKSFLCWDGGKDVIRFDHKALVFTRLRTPAGQPAPSPPAANGVFSRWRYMSDIDAFIGLAHADSNVWIYKAPA